MKWGCGFREETVRDVASLLAHLLAIVFLTRLPGPGGATLGYAFVLSWLMTSAMAWEMRLLGDPRRPNVWPAQAALFFALTVFIVRIMGVQQVALPVYEPSAFGWLGDVTSRFLGTVADALPAVLTDFFSNWRITLSILLFLCAMCVRATRFRMVALALILAVPLAASVVSDEGTFTLYAGTFCLLTGLMFQIRSSDRIRILRAAAARLKPLAVADPVFVREALRATLHLCDGKAYPQTFITQYLPRDSETVLRRMTVLDLAETHERAAEMTVRLSSSLRAESSLALLSRIPRAFFLLGIAALWVALPIDLIPDAIPFVGTLDDLAVGLLAFRALKAPVR